MELKHMLLDHDPLAWRLLIVPYGIETRLI